MKTCSMLYLPDGGVERVCYCGDDEACHDEKRSLEGFFEYVVPPLEGFGWQDNADGLDFTDKSSFHWISVIRLPDFVTKEDFDWAVKTATKKKKLDCSSAESRLKNTQDGERSIQRRGVHRCPQGAIEYGKISIGRRRYVNPALERSGAGRVPCS